MKNHSSPITLEVQAEAIWENGPNGPKLLRIEVRECFVIEAPLPDLATVLPESSTVH